MNRTRQMIKDLGDLQEENQRLKSEIRNLNFTNLGLTHAVNDLSLENANLLVKVKELEARLEESKDTTDSI